MSIKAKMNEASKLISDSFECRFVAAGLSMTLGSGWIEITLKYLFGSCSPVTKTFCGRQKWKHENDAQRKSSDTYKTVRIKHDTTLRQQLLMLVMDMKPSLLPLSLEKRT